MSQIAKQFFETLKGAKDVVNALAPGVKDFIPEAGAEINRLGTQGAMELASAFFNGNGFVPYGPGQYTPSAEPSQEHAHQHEHEQGHQQEQAMERSRGR